MERVMEVLHLIYPTYVVSSSEAGIMVVVSMPHDPLVLCNLISLKHILIL